MDRVSDLRPELVPRAFAQVREALVTLQMHDNGWNEDVAMVAMDALDYIEARLEMEQRVADSREHVCTPDAS